VAEYDLLPMQTGERGSFLRAHRLGRHQISAWRAQQAGQTAGKTGRVPASRRAKRTPDQVENERLVKQNAKLQAELAAARLALEITGKAHALLEMLSESAAAETEHERS
jgi:transposase